MCCDLQRIARTHQTKKCGISPTAVTLPNYYNTKSAPATLTLHISMLLLLFFRTFLKCLHMQLGISWHLPNTLYYTCGSKLHLIMALNLKELRTVSRRKSIRTVIIARSPTMKCLQHTSIIKLICRPQVKDSLLLNRRYVIEANK
jgi:hypothetical protein